MGTITDSKKQGGGNLRGNIAKKTASTLATITVAGGSTLIGMPEAEAGVSSQPYYFEKIDPNGNPIGGSEWEIRAENSESMRIIEEQWGRSPVEGNYKIVDNHVVKGGKERDDDGFILVSDLDPRPGHFAFTDADSRLPVMMRRQTALSLREVKRPDGYDSCGADQPVVNVEKINTIYTPLDKEETRFKIESGGSYTRVRSDNAEVRRPTDKRIQPGAFFPSNSTLYSREIDWSGTKESAQPIVYLPEQIDNNVTPAVVKDANGNSYEYGRWAFQPIHVIGAIVNCPVPTTTVETTAPVTTVTTTNPASTVTPPPATVTVPGGKVTKPGTTSTTVIAGSPVTVTPAPTTKTGPVETVTLPGTTVTLPDITSSRPNVTVTESLETITTTVAEPKVTTAVTSTLVEPTPTPISVETPSSTVHQLVTTVSSQAEHEVLLESETEEAASQERASESVTPTTTETSRSTKVLAATGTTGSLSGLLALAVVALIGCATLICRMTRQ